MKILMVIFLSISIYAQDSNNVNYQNINPPDIYLPIGLNSLKDNSLIKVAPLRYWNLNANSEENYKSEILFPVNIKEKKQNFIDNELFYILVGSAIVLGASAAYCKNESYKNYEKYKITNYSVYLTKSNNYDLYSGLAIGGLQINFGYLLYKFLSD
jgi:hypothetical protein